MIEMKVMGIAIDTASGSPIIVLNDKDNRKALPIWIGSAEASAIIRKIENIKVLRPMTHDLIIDVIEKTGYSVDRVEINDVEKETYFSTIYLTNEDGKEVTIDSRPSDAIAVAIRVDAPIFVSAKVLADGSVSCDSEKDEAESQEFRNFIQSIKPSDFEKLLKNDKQSDQ
ncbi:TPA: bifunctional nuclease family protein [Candidatus Avigastranaerophilus faecigallinarum]|nr:bifunctional nuclease family protein [Candidatus Avigastranaerophilus faecigallinarum]